MTVPAVEFIRRFLMHVLPPGFVKIRHFGFLANGARRIGLTLCRSLLSGIERAFLRCSVSHSAGLSNANARPVRLAHSASSAGSPGHPHPATYYDEPGFLMSKHSLIPRPRTTAILYTKCVSALYQRATPASLL
jgi:hypothetical protein